MTSRNFDTLPPIVTRSITSAFVLSTQILDPHPLKTMTSIMDDPIVDLTISELSNLILTIELASLKMQIV